MRNNSASKLLSKLRRIGKTNSLFGLLAGCAFFFHLPVFGQNFEFRFKNDIPVVVGNDTLRQAWAGGLNSPVFSTIDLNGDGQEDLFVFERTQNKVSIFLAVQQGSQWKWQYAPDYEAFFPKMEAWALLRDYNNDGRKDIFTYNNGDIKVYKNVTGPSGKPEFQLAQNILYFDAQNINILIGYYNLPSIEDVDGDGDLDILSWEPAAGQTIDFFRNMRVEQNLPNDSLRFTRASNWWGKVTKCTCNTFKFNSACRTSAPQHMGGASILAIDLDGDGDKDALIGQDLCPNLVALTNQGSRTAEAMSPSSLNLNYPSAKPASFENFLAPYYEDINFDGKKDLLVAPYLPSNADDHINMRKAVWLYQNNGTTANPSFTFADSSFLQRDMIDLGEGAAPAFADLDGDGDLDMLVGNYADNRSGKYISTISYYQNVGTSSRPIFKRVTSDYLQLSQFEYQNIQPILTDLNGDGAVDLVFTSMHGAGRIRYVYNTAAAGQPVNFPVANIQILSVGFSFNDIPVFHDLDNDGDLDLLISKYYTGKIEHYENTGSNASPVWTFRNGQLGNITSTPGIFGSYIAIQDLNGDNNPELIKMDDSGLIRIYMNFKQNLSGTFVEQTDNIFNPLQAVYQPGYLGFKPAFTFADLTGDTLPDLVVGTFGGGLLMLEQHKRLVQGLGKPTDRDLAWQLYPNPASRQVTIQGEEPLQVTVFDMVGRQVLSSNHNQQEHVLQVESLPPGVYLVQVRYKGSQKTSAKRLVIQP